MSRGAIELLKFAIVGLLIFGLFLAYNKVMGWRDAAMANGAAAEQANRTGAATADIAQGLPSAQGPVIQAESVDAIKRSREPECSWWDLACRRRRNAP